MCDLQCYQQTQGNNAFDIFVAIGDKMGKPTVTNNPLHRRPQVFTDRQHLFMVDEKDISHTIRQRQIEFGDVIVTNVDVEIFNASPLTGIMSISQILILKKSHTEIQNSSASGSF